MSRLPKTKAPAKVREAFSDPMIYIIWWMWIRSRITIKVLKMACIRVTTKVQKLIKVWAIAKHKELFNTLELAFLIWDVLSIVIKQEITCKVWFMEWAQVLLLVQKTKIRFIWPHSSNLQWRNRTSKVSITKIWQTKLRISLRTWMTFRVWTRSSLTFQWTGNRVSRTQLCTFLRYDLIWYYLNRCWTWKGNGSI